MFKVLATVVTVPMALAAGFMVGVCFAYTIGIDSLDVAMGGAAAGWFAGQTINIIWIS